MKVVALSDKKSVERTRLELRQPGKKQPTVLVVENHEEVRNMVGSMVVDQGWRALKVGSIGEAMTLLGRESIDAIVSDWELDDGIGSQILSHATTVHTPPIPTVMISSYASAELVAEARAAGAVDMLAKPFRIEDLTALLSRELQYRSWK